MASASRVFALLVRRSGQAVETVPIRRFPFLIGRGPEASLRLEVPGVWDRHLVLDLDSDQRLIAQAQDQALSTVNGERIADRQLRQGDQLGMGGVTCELVLSVAERRSLRLPELVLWSVVISITGVELFLLWRLGW